MKNKLNRELIRAGEDRAFNVFRDHIADVEGVWVERERVMRFRGVGRVMARKIFAVARHVEGGKMSRGLGKRGVDVVSLESVRTAIGRIADGMLAMRGKRAPSGAGLSLGRFIARTLPVS